MRVGIKGRGERRREREEKGRIANHPLGRPISLAWSACSVPAGSSTISSTLDPQVALQACQAYEQARQIYQQALTQAGGKGGLTKGEGIREGR